MWRMRAVILILVFLASSAFTALALPAAERTLPIWPPVEVNQLQAQRILVVVTHRETGRQTTMQYSETFPDAATAAAFAPVVQGAFFEWLETNYGMTRAEFNLEFDIEIKIESITDGVTYRRAA
jgi:hypothetical protein